MFARKTTLALLTGTLVAAGTVGGGAAVWAASAKPTDADSGIIHACANPRGVLRLSVNRECNRRELPVSWNQQGPPGPAGPSLNDFGAPLQAIATTDFAVPTTFTPVPGLSVTLPAAGTYLINAEVRGGIIYAAGPAHNCFIRADLATGNTEVPNSERLVVTDINGDTGADNVEATAPINMIIVATAGTVVTVRADQSCAGNPAPSVRIRLNNVGRSHIDAVRIRS